MARQMDLAALLDQLDPDAPLAQRHLWLMDLLRWVRGDAADARSAAWWRRASVGNGAPAWGDACCA